MNSIIKFSTAATLSAVLAGGCTMLDDSAAKKNSNAGLISTPPSYYSTAKARYLGTKYKDNLDRMIERIVRDPKTTTLQFANNISSVGGIGFFTHSATKSADERYLEVVLVTPETFEVKGAQSDKVNRLFSQYGQSLLGILLNDAEIFQDKELSGYGLNLAWRNVTAEATGNRVSMERAILYFSKEDARKFLRHEVNQNSLLGDAVIFAVEENGPLQLVSYKPQEARPDFRPAIREDNLIASSNAKVPSAPPVAPAEANPKAAPKSDPAKPVAKPVEPAVAVPPAKLAMAEPKAEVKTPVISEQKSPSVANKPATASAETTTKEKAPATKLAVTESKPEVKAPAVAEAKSPSVANRPTIPPVESATKEKAPAPKVIIESKAETKTPIVAEEKAPVAVTKPVPTAVEPSTKEKGSARPPLEPAAIAKASAEPAPATAKSPAPIKAEPRVEPKPAPVAVTVVKTPAAESQAEKAVAGAPVVAEKKPVEPQKAVAAAEAKPRETIPAPAPVVKPAPAPLPEIKSTPVPEAAPVKVENIPAALKRPVEVAAKPQPSSEEVKPAKAPAPARETRITEPVKAAPAPAPMAKAEAPLPAPKPAAPSIAAPQRDLASEKAAGEQVALLRNKPIEVIPENKPALKASPKALEGFIVQLAFNDKEKALRWAEDMEKRGFAVSITEAGAEGRLRVRLGNFVQRDDAERQLRNLKQQGLNGIIINLPQGFQPEARSSMP